ncbi:MAG: DUF4058 family protein [Cyanobacteria bacterium P01_F01_bin.3]
MAGGAHHWLITLIKESLPVVPMPLLQKDEVAVMDLQGVLGDVCDRGGFDYTLDYSRPLNPELPEDKANWANALLTQEKFKA